MGEGVSCLEKGGVISCRKAPPSLKSEAGLAGSTVGSVLEGMKGGGSMVEAGRTWRQAGSDARTAVIQRPCALSKLLGDKVGHVAVWAHSRDGLEMHYGVDTHHSCKSGVRSDSVSTILAAAVAMAYSRGAASWLPNRPFLVIIWSGLARKSL